MKEQLIHAFGVGTCRNVIYAKVDSNPDLMSLVPEIPLMECVPLYMFWCMENKEKEGELIIDYTIAALAEFGRAKNPHDNSLNFKFLCDKHQREVVLRFLKWRASQLCLDYNPTLFRAIRSWQCN